MKVIQVNKSWICRTHFTDEKTEAWRCGKTVPELAGGGERGGGRVHVAGGPGVREGKDQTGLGACLGQSFQLLFLPGRLAQEQMGVPMAILLGRPQPDMPVQGSTSHHCAGET